MDAAFLANAQSDSATDPLLDLLTINHADLPEPIRLVRDNVDVVSRGMTFSAFPFEFRRPGDGESGATGAAIRIDNVDTRLLQTIDALVTAPTLTIELVLRSAPDEVQQDFPPFTLSAVSGDRMVLQAELKDDDDDAEPVMRWVFTPGLAPAIHS